MNITPIDDDEHVVAVRSDGQFFSVLKLPPPLNGTAPVYATLYPADLDELCDHFATFQAAVESIQAKLTVSPGIEILTRDEDGFTAMISR